MGKTVTANGDASINTTTKKFGAGSCYLDGVGDYLTTPDHADFDFSDGTWTIDGQAYITDLSAWRTLYSHRTDDNNRLAIFVLDTGAVRFQITNGGVATLFDTAAGVITANTWYHIEVEENGDNYYIFVDGVNKHSSSNVVRPQNHTGLVHVGCRNMAAGNDYHFLGYIDEFRVSKVVRHTVDFTPPSAEHLVDSDTALLLHLNSDFTDYSDWLNSVADAIHSHSTDAIALTQVHNLLVNEILHSHVSDAIALTQVHNLLVNEILHSHVSDAISLLQVHNILVDEAIHSHVSDAIALIEIRIFTKQKQASLTTTKQKQASLTTTKQKQASLTTTKQKQASLTMTNQKQASTSWTKEKQS